MSGGRRVRFGRWVSFVVRGPEGWDGAGIGFAADAGAAAGWKQGHFGLEIDQQSHGAPVFVRETRGVALKERQRGFCGEFADGEGGAPRGRRRRLDLGIESAERFFDLVVDGVGFHGPGTAPGPAGVDDVVQEIGFDEVAGTEAIEVGAPVAVEDIAVLAREDEIFGGQAVDHGVAGDLAFPFGGFRAGRSFCIRAIGREAPF